MDSVSPSSEPSHDQWLTLSLSIAPHSQAQEQPRSQPQLLELLQTQPQPQPQPRPPQPQLLHLLQTQPQPRPPQPQLLDLLQTQPQPQPQPQLLDLLQTQPQPRPPQPQLLDLLQTQPQPRPPQPPPSPPAPFPNMPLVAPMRPSSLPPYQQEPCRQETYFLAPPFIPHPPSFHVHNLPQTRMLPFCDRPLLLGHQDQDQDPTYRSRQLLVPKCQKPTTPLATKKGKTETIDPPFPWATSTRATVYSLEHLLAHNIRSISGTVKCKQCDKRYDIEFDLEEKFRDVVRFVVRNRCNMHNRAPGAWMNSKVPTCKRCGIENVLRPVITKKRNINWLFLLLGQMIGCCTHAQLKYFCKHRLIHCTAAKDRLVYLTYLDLCKQLQPRGPFNP